MDEILNLDNQLCFRLYYISRKMTKAYEPLLKKYGLTYPQYIVMLGLFKSEKIDFKDLSQMVNLAPGTLTPILQRLEQMKLLSRDKNDNDSRKVDIVLSPQGKLLREQIVDVPQGLAEKLQISLEKYSLLIQELDELDHLLDEANKETSEYQEES